MPQEERVGFGNRQCYRRFMVKLPAAALFAFLLSACAHRVDKPPIELPSAAEIGGYVAAHWGTDFNQRFSRFASRPGRSSEFVSVQNPQCYLNWGGAVAECAYEVTANFSGEETVTRQLQSQFERDGDGALTEVLIIWHERKR